MSIRNYQVYAQPKIVIYATTITYLRIAGHTTFPRAVFPVRNSALLIMATNGNRSYGKAAGKSAESAVRREKKGTLRSGKAGNGGPVTSRKRAIAVGLSEARKKGAKVPEKKAS